MATWVVGRRLQCPEICDDINVAVFWTRKLERISMLRAIVSVLRRSLRRGLRGAARLLGRPQPLSPRAAILATIPASAAVLEIGPFVRPTLRGPNIRYFDVLDKASMIELASVYGDPVVEAVEIDFISPTGDLSVVTETFDVVFSSHCIEHQPDLVRHLQQVEKLLKSDGRYVVIVPDKRYCFDHFIPVSGLDEVLEAWREKRKVHTRKKVIEHRAYITHNDAVRHWAGDHGAPLYVRLPQKLVEAASEFESRQGNYIDVHGWQFSPKTFNDLIAGLVELNRSPLQVTETYQTWPDTLEFSAVLKRA